MLSKYSTTKKMTEKHSEWLSPTSMRNLVANSHKNGLDSAGVIVRIGKKVLIDEQRFAEWVEGHRESNEKAGA